jgi:2,4-dienoyl-CoA reductase-like NADH-dependent reductase (Old Yellow Enzyme family)
MLASKLCQELFAFISVPPVDIGLALHYPAHIMPKVTLAEVLPTPRKLTTKDVQEIRSLYAQGAAKSKLAKAFGVSRQAITYHLRREANA